MASFDEKLRAKKTYAFDILPQVRGAAEAGIPLEDLDIPAEYISQATADYQAAGMSMPENAWREVKETVKSLPEMAKVVGKGVAKAALPIDFFPEDPGLDEIAKEIAAGSIEEIGSAFSDPERMRVAPLATAGALLGPLVPSFGKFSKIKKPANKGKTKILGDIEEADRTITKRDKYDGEGTKSGLKYDQDIEPTETSNEMSAVEQEALDIVDPERLPGGRKWNESFEKGADELRPNRDRGAPYDKTFIDDSDSSITPDDMEAAGKFTPIRKPKSSDFDTDKWTPDMDPDEALDIGETPNYPSKEIMDVENLSPSDAEAMSLYQELARESYAEGGSQRPGMFAASRKSPEGTSATTPTWRERLGEMLRKEKPAEPAAKPQPEWEDVNMEDSGEFLTIEEPAQVRGARVAPAQAIEDMPVRAQLPATTLDAIQARLQRDVGDIAGQIPQSLNQRARAETLEIIRQRRRAGKAAGQGLADKIYAERLAALEAQEAAQKALDAEIAADTARRTQAEDLFRSGENKKQIQIPGTGEFNEDLLAKVGRIIDEDQAVAERGPVLKSQKAAAEKMAAGIDDGLKFEKADLKALESAGLSPIMRGEQIKPQSGEGAFGRVYTVTDKSGEIKRAAKVQDLPSSQRETVVREALAEIERTDPSMRGFAPRFYGQTIDEAAGRGVILMEHLNPLNAREKAWLKEFIPRDVNRTIVRSGTENPPYMEVLKQLSNPDAPDFVRQFGYKLTRLWQNHGVEFRDLGVNNVMVRINSKGKPELVAADVGNFTVPGQTDPEWTFNF